MRLTEQWPGSPLFSHHLPTSQHVMSLHVVVNARPALISSMASSSTTTSLSKELWEQFGSTPGCNESFIQQCASMHLFNNRYIITHLPYVLTSAKALISPQLTCTSN